MQARYKGSKMDRQRWERSELYRFTRSVEAEIGRTFENYQDLLGWSIAESERFWEMAAAFLEIKWTMKAKTPFEPPPAGQMRGGRWFPGSLLSWTENLLPEGDAVKIISIIEGRKEPILYTGFALQRSVARLARAFSKQGVKSGDRVAGVLPNTAEAIIAMLASTALGAVWTSCSPDFGAAGIIDRFGQVEPTVLVATRSYMYNGKVFDCRATADAVHAALPSLRFAVMIDPLEEGGLREPWRAWDEVLASEADADQLPFAYASTPFDHPLYILYSSGTTGKPKCLVHSVGGTLLQHKKELILHSDLGPGKRLLYFTTCGWMMWNWMASGLSTGAGLVLFEGSVTRDNHGVLWHAVAEHRVDCFGTSPRFLAACEQASLRPREIYDLSGLSTILSTGSPLLPEQFAWVDKEVKEGVHLASISGGTDIVSCFMLGNPWSEVRPGEIQGAGLGMAVECWSETGEALTDEKGELVCVKPFPSMPLGFWKDDGSKYFETYFNFFPQREVWRHGDYIEIKAEGGIVVYGRSDATLNPGGVRIGTAEIYRQVEAFPLVQDSLAIARDKRGDVEVLLFIKLKDPAGGESPALATQDLLQQIKQRIKRQLSPRHVPAEIFVVADIPYTRSGKKLELAVSRIFHGQALDNATAIANPESLEDFQRIAAAAGDGSGKV